MKNNSFPAAMEKRNGCKKKFENIHTRKSLIHFNDVYMTKDLRWYSASVNNKPGAMIQYSDLMMSQI